MDSLIACLNLLTYSMKHTGKTFHDDNCKHQVMEFVYIVTEKKISYIIFNIKNTKIQRKKCDTREHCFIW